MSIRVPLDIFLQNKNKKIKNAAKAKRFEGMRGRLESKAQKEKKNPIPPMESDIHKGATGRQSELVY